MISAVAAEAQSLSPASSVRFSSDFITAEVSLNYPGLVALSLDSLGKSRFPLVSISPPSDHPLPTEAERVGSAVEYRRPGVSVPRPWLRLPVIGHSQEPRWTIEVGKKEIQFKSFWLAADPPEPLVLNFDNSICHVTLLGRMEADGSIKLPAILHFPDQGSVRISANPADVPALGYETSSGDLAANQAKTVRVILPAATAARRTITYRWEVAAIYPKIAGLANDARFDGFRRNWLNIFQLAPRWRTLANHAASDTCAFCYYEYADMAAQTPALAKDFRALDMVQQTLDRIMAGANAYGMPGHGNFPEFSADTYPSLLIAAGDCAKAAAGRSDAWVKTNYTRLQFWADQMLGTIHNDGGLIEYSLSGNSGSWPAQIKFRPANWWDTIGFGHEDAYANALAYRALKEMADIAKETKHFEDQARYRAAADKIQAAYFKTFYNPETGVLAGWRSADGQLHDYYFMWVNGIAIHYGLVPADKANAIMTRLLAKMKEAGFARFDLGLPGNLVPVALKDYVDHNPRFGGGQREDNTDAFQRYENGGATACFAYFTLAALYDLDRVHEGDQILLPLLGAFGQGGFQGRGDNGMSKDWKAWDGACWGYEGFLTDNYYALLAVLDRQAALEREQN